MVTGDMQTTDNEVPTARKHEPLLRNNLRQLTLIVLGFLVVVSLLESKGLVVWAQRLDAGPVRQQALAVTQGFDRMWGTVAAPITNLRPEALAFLTAHNWSDMPAQEDGQIPAGKPEVVLSAQLQNGTDLTTLSPVSPSGTEPTPGIGTRSPLPVAATGLPVVQPDALGSLVPLPQATVDKPRRVALAGDSMMAVGLSGQLQRDLAPFKTSVTTIRAFRPATGLARPDVFDWQKEYPLMAGNGKPDVVVVAIGANDTQNLEIGGKVLTIGSVEWRAAYRQRVTDYLNMLTQDGAVVLWIKLPPMRPAKYNRNVTVVNEVAQEVVTSNPRAIWWDVSSRYVDAKGQFREFANVGDSRRQVRIRQSDGIHLTEAGAKLISEDIIGWIHPASLQSDQPEKTTNVTGPVEQREDEPRSNAPGHTETNADSIIGSNAASSEAQPAAIATL